MTMFIFIYTRGHEKHQISETQNMYGNFGDTSGAVYGRLKESFWFIVREAFRLDLTICIICVFEIGSFSSTGLWERVWK